jgi:hypothetical protein
MDIEASPTYQALPEHAKPAWLKAVRALPPAWLLPPATGERFEGRDHCLKRLNGFGLYEGFCRCFGKGLEGNNAALAVPLQDARQSNC